MKRANQSSITLVRVYNRASKCNEPQQKVFQLVVVSSVISKCCCRLRALFAERAWSRTGSAGNKAEFVDSQKWPSVVSHIIAGRIRPETATTSMIQDCVTLRAPTFAVVALLGGVNGTLYEHIAEALCGEDE